MRESHSSPRRAQMHPSVHRSLLDHVSARLPRPPGVLEGRGGIILMASAQSRSRRSALRDGPGLPRTLLWRDRRAEGVVQGDLTDHPPETTDIPQGHRGDGENTCRPRSRCVQEHLLDEMHLLALHLLYPREDLLCVRTREFEKGADTLPEVPVYPLTESKERFHDRTLNPPLHPLRHQDHPCHRLQAVSDLLQGFGD